MTTMETKPHTRTEPHARTHEETDGRSFPALLRELRNEAVDLVQKEFLLAKKEISEKVNEAERAIATSVGGAVMMVAGLITLCGALAAGLYVAMILWEVSPAISLWLSPLIVGLTVLLIGWAMTQRAKKVTSKEHWRPDRTERTVRETKRWAERKF